MSFLLVNGCPATECCPPQVFPAPPEGLHGYLDGLLWELPITGPGPDDVQIWPTPIVDSNVLSSTAVQHVFTVRLRIRGVAEDNFYIGGAVVAGTGSFCYDGGAEQVHTGRNIYSLSVSNPVKTYFLNHNPLGYTGVRITDFQFTVHVATGATVTLIADHVDGIEVPNTGLLQVPVPIGDPPIRVTQPYDGQFLQMDVVFVG